MAAGSNRTFVLIGGAGFSLLGAVIVVLAVLGTRLAFDSGEHAANGARELDSIAIGAPEAAARSVDRATRAVADAPVRPVAAAVPPTAPTPLGGAGAVGGVTATAPAPPPAPAPVKPGDPAPTPKPPGGSGGSESPGSGGGASPDVGLEPLISPSGGVIDTTIGGVYKGLQPPLNDLTGNLVGALNTTLTGIGALLEGLGDPRE